MRDRYDDMGEVAEGTASAWEAVFGGRNSAPMNRAQRRAHEKELASSIRRNQRAYARRMKKEASDGE